MDVCCGMTLIIHDPRLSQLLKLGPFWASVNLLICHVMDAMRRVDLA